MTNSVNANRHGSHAAEGPLKNATADFITIYHTSFSPEESRTNQAATVLETVSADELLAVAATI